MKQVPFVIAAMGAGREESLLSRVYTGEGPLTSAGGSHQRWTVVLLTPVTMGDLSWAGAEWQKDTEGH